MKKWISIIVGVLLLVSQAINLYFITRIDNREHDIPSRSAKLQDTKINNESPVMNIEQAADYVGVTTEQLMKMIQIEKNELSQRGSFSGEMIPYFQVNEDFLFYRNQVDVWLEYASIENIEYNLVEGYRFK